MKTPTLDCSGFRWLGLCCLSLAGCAAPTEIGFSAPTNTPDYYSENHPYYLDDLSTCEQFTAPTRRLRHLYEFNHKRGGSFSSLAIEDGSPLGVIVSGVRIPEDLPGGTRDLAVVIDLVTTTRSEPQSLVVYYQRDVPAGQMLNFENLLVYFDPEWDATTPPYFRLRIIDVYKERNSRIQSMLDRVGSLGASISGLMPHEIIPIVGVAQEAARLVLGNRENRTLLDYQIQLYSAAVAQASGGADVGVLRAGAWIVVGRPRFARDGRGKLTLEYEPQHRTTSMPACFECGSPDPADFWREPLDWDRRTKQLLHVNTGSPVYAPYVSVIVTRADVQVPKHVMDRSADLVKLLSTTAGKSDTFALEHALDALTRSVDAFSLKRQLTRYRDIGDLGRLVQVLAQNIPPEAASEHRRWTPPLSHTEEAELMRFVNAVVQTGAGGPFKDPKELHTWWQDTGRHGLLVATPGVQPGVEWQRRPESRNCAPNAGPSQKPEAPPIDPQPEAQPEVPPTPAAPISPNKVSTAPN